MMGLLVVVASAFVVADPLVFQTESFEYKLSEAARSVAFVDRSTGVDYCDTGSLQPFATWIDQDAHPASAARLEGDRLSIAFSDGEREAIFRVGVHRQRIEFELVDLQGPVDSLQELHFAAIPLTLSGTLDAPFAVSPLALTLETQCAEIPGFNVTLSGAQCFAALGMKGAAVAIIGCPGEALRDALKDAISAAPGLARSSNGGPWALDSQINRQSYLVDFSGTVNEQSVESWIAMLKGLGVKQLDLHGGQAFRFGDYMPNPAVFPEGRKSLKRVVDALHAAGIAAGLHTYAMFLAKETPWVTPVPHPGLAKAATFTLAGELSDSDTVVPVAESTSEVSSITGFHVRNSATIQIDDELIVFKSASKEAPFAFGDCIRGANGTTPAPHSAGAKVHRLKECFGLFAPDPESSLYDELIKETARTYNECGFDMMYMDALDGSDVIDLKADGQFGWYYAAKFTHDLVRQLNQPPVLEMSTFGHHLWVLRSRMGAWDACQRAPHTFVDIHQMSNAEWQGHFLPTNLGWWAIFPWSGVQPKRTLPDDVEYLCAKALATDSSLAWLLGFSPETYGDSDNQQRLGDIMRRYETLRLANVVPQSVRERLAAPGQAFRLEEDDEGGFQFRPVAHLRHDVTLDSRSNEWQVVNPHAAQVPRILIEMQLALEPFEAPEGKVVEDFADFQKYEAVKCNDGVAAAFSSMNTPVRDAPLSAAFTATNSTADRTHSWAYTRRVFDPPISLQGRGLGLWVHGDGKGALLNVQLRSPLHVSPALSEHYVRLDFSGWKYIELVDPEDYEIEAYRWPYSRPRSEWSENIATAMSFAYPVYHAHLDYSQVGELHLAVNDIPLGEEVQVYLGPIRSIPHRTVRLDGPSININGQLLTFPVELESGQLLEFTPPRAYTVRDQAGEAIDSGLIAGVAPALERGDNSIEFVRAPPGEVAARARVTITTAGEALEP